MATRNSSEVERRRLRVRKKGAQTSPRTQATYPATGSPRPRNSTRARKARSAKRSGPSHRLPTQRRQSSSASAIPVEIGNAIEDQRSSLATAMSVLYCLHTELRRQTEDGGMDESDAVKNATEWADLAEVTAMLLVQLHAIHLSLDSVSLRGAL
jgi:hypothetical protein